MAINQRVVHSQNVMRGTMTFFHQDGYGIQQKLPASPIDVAGSFTCALVECRPTQGRLRKLLGARRSTVQALYD